jgi:hypothetical protein
MYTGILTFWDLGRRLRVQIPARVWGVGNIYVHAFQSYRLMDAFPGKMNIIYSFFKYIFL